MRQSEVRCYIQKSSLLIMGDVKQRGRAELGLMVGIGFTVITIGSVFGSLLRPRLWC